MMFRAIFEDEIIDKFWGQLYTSIRSYKLESRQSL